MRSCADLLSVVACSLVTITGFRHLQRFRVVRQEMPLIYRESTYRVNSLINLTVSIVFSLKLTLKLLISFTLATMMISTVSAQPPTLLWSDDVTTNDIALSKDGQYVAIASGSQVRFYGRSSGTPIWTYSPAEVVRSVAISADGDCGSRWGS